MGGNAYSRPGWDIANNKQQLVAYLQQFLPAIITIGHMEDLTAIEAAQYIKLVLDTADVHPRMRPSIIVADKIIDLEADIKKIFEAR